MADKKVALREKTFQKAKDALEALLKGEILDLDKIQSQLTVFRSKYETFKASLETIIQEYLEKDNEAEFLKADDQLSDAEVSYDGLVRRAKGILEADTSKMNLPAVKLQTFSGDVREWLQFWSCFSEVHNNKLISSTEKFQYLLSCLPPNSQARRLISGLPVCGSNYNDAVQRLFEQYPDSLVIKVYVREITKLIIRNANDKTRMEFSDLVSTLTCHINNLESLGVTTDNCESLLYPVVESCLPEEVLISWQKDATHEDKIEPLMSFLNKEVRLRMERDLAKMDLSSDDEGQSVNHHEKKKNDIATATGLMATNGKKPMKVEICPFCEKKGHKASRCLAAKRMTYNEISEVVRRNHLCFLCFKPDHQSNECTSQDTCTVCDGKHHELVCRKKGTGSFQRTNTMMAPPFGMQYGTNYPQMYQMPDQGVLAPYQQQNQQLNLQYGNNWSTRQVPTAVPSTNNGFSQAAVPSSNQTARGGHLSGQVRRTSDFQNVAYGGGEINLMTIPLMIESQHGLVQVRAFLDGGSEESYILKEVAESLGLPSCGSQMMQHQVFGGGVSGPIQHTLHDITFVGIDGGNKIKLRVNAITMIAHKIRKPAVIGYGELLQQHGITVLDQSNASEGVQLLFGSDVLPQIWTGGFVRVTPTLICKHTVFGWVFQGKVESDDSRRVTTSHLCTSFMAGLLTEEDMWSLDMLGIQDESRKQTRYDLERAALLHFEETVKRMDNGRYVVSLPWIEGHKELLSNKVLATSRLYNVTRNLKNEGYFEAYHNVFVNDWLAQGIIEEDPGNSDGLDYFLPHRHVIKLGSTTPVRPVFDASAKGKGSPSLNECLEKGPNTLELIPANICRFRRKRYGIVGDIKKAFLQMAVAEKDRSVLKFLWWEDSTCKKIKVYRHCRVVFGVKPSPFLLAATLQHHINNEGSGDPTHAEELLKSFYVDNSVSSHDTLQEAMEFKDKSVKLLWSAQMDLRGWEVSHQENNDVPLLGMMWNTADDTISFYMERICKKLEAPFTKRGLLSVCNSIFDPMGFVSPVTIVPKLLFQKCCALKINWDEELPEDIVKQFLKWKSQVPLLSSFKVPRWMCQAQNEASISLEVFSDASGAAMSACVFVRTTSYSGDITVQLVMAKSRLAPLRNKPGIPKLELIGCLMAARLSNEVEQYLGLEGVKKRFFTDSSTCYAWITRDKPWERFVQNRVDEIRRLTCTSEWNHVSGELNPADLPSRGCSVEYLLQCQWWEGYSWMKEKESTWKISTVSYNEDEVNAGLKKTVVSAAVTKQQHVLDHVYQDSSNDFEKCLRITAIVYRYLSTLRDRVRAKKAGVSCEELKLKKTVFILNVNDIERAEEEIVRIVQNRTLDGLSDKRLKKLDCFVDDTGVIRFKSQLFFGEDDRLVRCPAVLPYDDVLVQKVIMSEHCKNNHAGVLTTLALLRKQFWILNGRRSVGKVIWTCPTCRRFLAKKCVVPSAPLSRNRIKDTAAFDITGVDLFGPLYLRGGDRVWGVLYTCAIYRCIHLEVVDTLSADGFIQTLRRFVSIRGLPSQIYSDNGTNFVGSNNLFAVLDWVQVLEYANVQRIVWTFNPPTAAWWGGWWERLVGLTKNLLRRVLGKRVVNLVELQTILCEVSATLNQRPLTFLSDQDGEVIPLTPSFFIMELQCSNLPEADLVDASALVGAARELQKLREDLRSRFRLEYLAELKHAMGTKYVTVGVGDLVLIEAHDRKRIDWPLGLVKQVYPGRDGKTRTALVKTATGEYLRPVQRLYLLECALCEVAPEIPVQELEPVDDEYSADNETESDALANVTPEHKDVVEDEPDEIPVRTRRGRMIVRPDRLIQHI